MSRLLDCMPFVCHFDGIHVGSNSVMSFRKRLLKTGDLSDPELNYLMRMVDLLATCAEVCRNVLQIAHIHCYLINVLPGREQIHRVNVSEHFLD